MSKTEASAAKTVEKVEIDLSEKGLTELARMLVQSGRMSAPSFTNWCSRVAPSASRWARSQSDAKEAAAGTSGKAGNRKGSKTTNTAAPVAVQPGNTSVKVNKKTVNDGLKFSGFIKAHPYESVGSWAEVLSASSEDKERWMMDHLMVRGKAPSKETVLNILGGFGLNEAEIKQSRAWFPFLPDSSAQYHALVSSYDEDAGLIEPGTELYDKAPAPAASYAAAASRDTIPAGSTGTSLSGGPPLSAEAKVFKGTALKYTSIDIPSKPDNVWFKAGKARGRGKDKKSGNA